MSEQSSYDALGVSASKSGLHAVLQKAGMEESNHGLFASITPDIAGNEDYVSFVHCDGAGTKTIVPYLLAKETGSTHYFAGLAQDALVMNLDDVYCLGQVESLVLANAIARNQLIIDDEMLGAIISSYKSLTSSMQQHGIPLALTGGETADCGDIVQTAVVDAVISGRIRKDALVSTHAITTGDVIIGLSSTGKASYEDIDNSGISSNGLTLARHALLTKAYTEEYPEVVNPKLDKSVVYRGPFRVTDSPEILKGKTIGEALASPTRTYAPVLKSLYETLGAEIHGVIHNTGGGQTKVLRFGRKKGDKAKHYIKDNLFSPPPLFQLIQKHGDVTWKEMYQVFNMGHRMEIYSAESNAKKIIEVANDFGIEAQVVGRVEESTERSNKVTLETTQGAFEYSL